MTQFKADERGSCAVITLPRRSAAPHLETHETDDLSLDRHQIDISHRCGKIEVPVQEAERITQPESNPGMLGRLWNAAAEYGKTVLKVATVAVPTALTTALVASSFGAVAAMAATILVIAASSMVARRI